MQTYLSRLFLVLAFMGATTLTAPADDRAGGQQLREETWALMTPLPMFAYVVRPVAGGPFPLAVMNHGIAIGEKERSFFPLIEFRDAAFWFARHGYVVVAPVRYGATAVDMPERGHHSLFFAGVGNCDNPNFRGPGLAIVYRLHGRRRDGHPGKGHCRGAVRRRMGCYRILQPEPLFGTRDHHLCGWARRACGW